MNINYDEIITKANERAERLKALTEQIAPVQEKAHQLIDALIYFRDLSVAVELLDSEGKALLPPGVASRAMRVGQEVNKALEVFVRCTDSNGSNERQVLALAEAATKS